jgi:hypothetical protein
MRVLRLLAAVALFLSAVGSLEAAKGKKTKPVKGTVTSIKQDEGKESGTITVTVKTKKKGAPATTEARTFQVSESTKLETVTGKKKNTTATAAKFADLAEGKLVTVLARGDTVESVKIANAKKKKKSK